MPLGRAEVSRCGSGTARSVANANGAKGRAILSENRLSLPNVECS